MVVGRGARALLSSAALLATALSPLACREFRTATANPTDASPTGGDDAGVDAQPGELGASAGGFTVVRHDADGGSLSDVFGFGPTDIHAVGENGVILDYDGATWREIGGTSGALLAKVWGASPDDVYAVGVLAEGGRGIVMHNDGSGWAEMREFDVGLTSVWGTKDFVLVGGFDGKIYKKTPTRDWYLLVTLEKNPYATPDPVAHPDDRFMPVVDAIWGNDATHIAAACDLDTTVFYRDPSQWVPEYDPVNRKRRFRKVWGPPSDNYNFFFGANYYGVWQVQSDITVSFTLNEERDLPERENEFVWGIWGPSSDHVLFVGDKGRIMSFADAKVRVRPSPTPVGLSAVWGSSADDVWIVGDEMTILHGSMPR